MHINKKSRAAAGAFVVAILAGGTAACGSDSDSSDMSPAAAVKAASEKNEKITSLSYKIKGTYPGQGKVEGAAQMSVKPAAMSMKLTTDTPGQPGEVEIIMVDEAMYLGGTPEAAEEMGGKRFLKMDLSGLDQAGKGAAGGPGKVPGQVGQNPAAESGFLDGADDVKKIGTATVEGEKTTQYRGTVAVKALRASLKDEKAETRKQREKSLKQYEDLGVKNLTMDIWITEEDRTKQFRMQGDTGQGKLDVTMTFGDVNKPVTVKAPPASEVMDLAEMMKDVEAEPAA
ncbi:DUF1396 domain-containing protein [Streptomyces sp. NPDC059578]|uniref:DUF1396 domain-containing protein n=1 Tax=Streptomyces sp. NPDC059578 TaxID=3346874 RepID=UPI0036871C8A